MSKAREILNTLPKSQGRSTTYILTKHLSGTARESRDVRDTTGNETPENFL